MTATQRNFLPQPMDEETRTFFRLDKHPNKQDFINRIRGRLADKLPTWEVAVDPQPMATILEKPTTCNFTSADPADCVELCQRTGICGIGFGIFYSPCRTDHRLQTREGFEAIRKDEPPSFDQQFDRIGQLRDATRGTDIGVWTYTHGPFDPIYLAMDLQEFWLLAMDDPKFLYEVGDFLLEVNLGIMERIVAAGVDWVFVGDDCAFRIGLMIQPEFFFDYYPQRLKKLLAPAKKANVPVIFHSDGKIDSMIDMLADCGIDALHPLEPYSNDPFSIAELAAERFGLIGNVELASFAPEQAYDRTRELIAAMGPRYVPASSHSLTNDVKPETYAAFLQAVQQD